MKTITITNFFLLVFYTFSLFNPACSPPAKNDRKKGFISIYGQRFVDASGRELIFHGINLVNKNPEENYLGPEDREAIKKIKSWGFNCIRLGIIWDGLEPEPGKYDENYLRGIDDRVRWAAENDLYVLLDMHQDLYSVLYSDGAPEWATLSEDKPHVTGEIWSESYFISPAVQTAFDNFWKNAAASDGTGIQDHFINAWRHIANRYADQTIIIGYDLMNEPFMGSEAVNIMPSLFKAYAELLVSEGQVPPPAEEELIQMWSSGEERIKVYDKLSDPEKFSSVFDSVYPLHAPFEKNVLMPFYQKCRDAIREVDPNHILFIEHGIFANSGVLSDIQPLLTTTGEKDPLVAYAPHGYDLVTDTRYQEASSFDRVAFIFNRIDQTGQRLEMPVLVGEWGAFYASEEPAVTEQASFIMDQYERRLFSHTYWSYFERLDQMPYFKALQKPYPMAISGILQSWDYDQESGTLEVRWEESEQFSPGTLVYVPAVPGDIKNSLELDPGSDYEVEGLEDGMAGIINIQPLGRKAGRMLR